MTTTFSPCNSTWNTPPRALKECSSTAPTNSSNGTYIQDQGQIVAGLTNVPSTEELLSGLLQGLLP